jgi:hypothetical protein
MFLSCSYPENEDVLSWYAKYSVPLAKNTITTSDIFTGSSGFLNVFDKDSIKVGDTLNIAYTDTMVNHYSTKIFSQEDITISEPIGKFQLFNLPPYSFPFVITDSAFPTIPLPFSIPIDLEAYSVINIFDYMIIDKNSSNIYLSLENNSESILFKDIYATILDHDDVILAIDTIHQLFPKKKAVRTFSLAGKKIDRRLKSKLHAVIAKNSVIKTDSIITLTMSVGNQIIEEIVINDVNFEYQFNYDFDMPLNLDTFNIDYFDFSRLYFPVTIFNETPLQFKITPVLGNLISIGYCKRNDIYSIHDLDRIELDSNYFLGNNFTPAAIYGTSIPEYPYETSTLFTLDSCRVIPKWNNKSFFSQIPVSISGKILSRNKKMKINKNMRIGVKIERPQIDFTELQGAYMVDKIFRGNPAVLNLSFLNSTNIIDELRDKFKLIHNNFDLAIKFLIEDETHISTALYNFQLFLPDDPLKEIDTLNWVMNNIKKDSPYSFGFNIDNTINLFPDSLKYKLNYSFPKNERLHFGNKVLQNKPNISSVDFQIETGMNLNLFMVWEVKDTVNIRLPDTKTALNFNQGFKSFLHDMTLSIDYVLFNQTNINGCLFVLGSTTEHREELLNLSYLEINPNILSTEKGRNLIPLLGESGILIPPRSNTVQDLCCLEDIHMNGILNSDSLYIRWGLILFPATADALVDTDYISIDAQFNLEGIQSTQSNNGNL